jgi:hypothetical protein
MGANQRIGVLQASGNGFCTTRRGPPQQFETVEGLAADFWKWIVQQEEQLIATQGGSQRPRSRLRGRPRVVSQQVCLS